jgi:hypothetical protein
LQRRRLTIVDFSKTRTLDNERINEKENS